jgi:hypothetical protein
MPIIDALKITEKGLRNKAAKYIGNEEDNIKIVVFTPYVDEYGNKEWYQVYFNEDEKYTENTDGTFTKTTKYSFAAFDNSLGLFSEKVYADSFWSKIKFDTSLIDEKCILRLNIHEFYYLYERFLGVEAAEKAKKRAETKERNQNKKAAESLATRELTRFVIAPKFF